MVRGLTCPPNATQGVVCAGGIGERVGKGRKDAHVAQSVEHILGKDEVSGSIPLVGSMMVSGSDGWRRRCPVFRIGFWIDRT